MPKEKFKKPDLIVFDLDNTLYQYGPCHKAGEDAFIEFASKTLGMRRKQVRDKLRKARLNVKERIEGAASHERCLYFAEFLDITSEVNDARFILDAENLYWSNYFSQMELAPFVKELIIQARANGSRTALVTDFTAMIQYRKLVHLGVENLFDVIVTSQETRGEKETNEPFDLLARRMNKYRGIDEVWFIGDVITDFPKSYDSKAKKFFLSPFANEKIHSQDITLLRNYKTLLKRILN
jgi:FMN phosphatase YigB (HAD superfamily)